MLCQISTNPQKFLCVAHFSPPKKFPPFLCEKKREKLLQKRKNWRAKEKRRLQTTKHRRKKPMKVSSTRCNKEKRGNSLSRMGDANTGQVSLDPIKGRESQNRKKLLCTAKCFYPGSFLSHSKSTTKPKRSFARHATDADLPWQGKMNPQPQSKKSPFQKDWTLCLVFEKKEEKSELNFLEPGRKEKKKVIFSLFSLKEFFTLPILCFFFVLGLPSFPSQQLQVLLTLFSEFFAFFSHGTCSLSVFCQNI